MLTDTAQGGIPRDFMNHHNRLQLQFLALSKVFFRQEKQHKLKLFGPEFPADVQTLTPECLGVKKFLTATGAALKRTFWRGRPGFSARTSLTRRVPEKLCAEKV